MRTRLSEAATFLVLFLVPTISAGQDCGAILRHGLRNIEISKSAEASIATKYFNHCHKSFSDISDNLLASIEVEIFGVAGVEGSYSRAQRQTSLLDWCKANREIAETHQSDYRESQHIYADGVAAWSQCNSLVSKEVQISPLISQDQRSVLISVYYFGHTTSGVLFYGVESEGFECATAIPVEGGATTELNPSRPPEIKNRAISINCKREAPRVESDRDGTSYERLNRGVIAVRTASFPFQLYFPEHRLPVLSQEAEQSLRSEIDSLEQRLRKEILDSAPVGAILPYAGPGENIPDGWLLCDGAKLGRKDAPELFAVIGAAWGAPDSLSFALPDLRGRFLRGVDAGAHRDPDAAGRGESSENGNRGDAVGTVQGDALQQHRHQYDKLFLDWGHLDKNQAANLHENNDGGYDTVNSGDVLGAAAASETRPKNVAVNWIIRAR